MAAADPLVEVAGLSRRFGQLWALREVSFTLEAGSVTGFVGANGAGKSTLLSCLFGLIRPTSGAVRIAGEPIRRPGQAVLSRCAYVPDVAAFADWMRAEEWMEATGRLLGLPRPLRRERTRALLDLAGLSSRPQRIGQFSRGMRQRLAIAQALLGAPELLVLDEPTSALDPAGRRDVLDMIASLSGRATVLFSTHIIADVERVCEDCLVLDEGHLLAHDSIRSLTGRDAPSWRVVVDAPEAFAAALAPYDDIELDGQRLRGPADIVEHIVPRAAATSGAALKEFRRSHRSLEDACLALRG